MGVVKHKKTKTDNAKHKEIPNGKPKNDKEKVKKKKLVSCLQCIKSNEDGTRLFIILNCYYCFV